MSFAYNDALDDNTTAATEAITTLSLSTGATCETRPYFSAAK